MIVDELMRRVDVSGDLELIQLNYVNGVRRRPIQCRDPYHWGNLGVQNASQGMAGNTANGKHEQCHHCQLLQSMHSLHSDDPAFSQAMMDRVTKYGPHVKIRTWRELQK